MRWTYALTAGLLLVWGVLLWFETGALWSYFLAGLGLSVAYSGHQKAGDAEAEG